MAQEIRLDRKSFKTLASGTRVNILKSLDIRRKTLSELSKEFGMSVSTIKEHLDNLSAVNLVVQKDEGHKWKYYELTRKGNKILHPEETRIWIILSLSAVALLVTGYDYIQRFFLFGAAPLAGTRIEAPATAPPLGQAAISLPWLHIIGFVLFTVILGISVGYLIRSKRGLITGL